MAKKADKTSKKKTKKTAPKTLRQRLRRLFWRSLFAVALFVVLITGLFTIVNPPTTPYMFSEARRLGGIERDWVPLEDIAPVMARSAVAAEDADFCLHWGIDVNAVQAAIDAGGTRGASTISQQVVKNVYLWHGRSWFRKSLEALWTPLLEVIWTKRRILEVYLNVAEFDEGVFGVQAAAQHYFGRNAIDLSDTEAARLAMVLPAPKTRSASRPTQAQQRRTKGILDGAATILVDGRAQCFEG